MPRAISAATCALKEVILRHSAELCAVTDFANKQFPRVREQFGHQHQPSNIQLFITQNRQGVCDALANSCRSSPGPAEAPGYDLSPPHRTGDDCASSSSDSDSAVDEEFYIFDSNEETFLRLPLDLSYVEWQSISPITVEYKRGDDVRTHRVLKTGWTSLLGAKLASTHAVAISCCWKFRRAVCTENGAVFLRLFAECTRCGDAAHRLYGELVREPNLGADRVTIQFSMRTRGTGHIVDAKMRLSGDRRSSL